MLARENLKSLSDQRQATAAAAARAGVQANKLLRLTSWLPLVVNNLLVQILLLLRVLAMLVLHKMYWLSMLPLFTELHSNLQRQILLALKVRILLPRVLASSLVKE
jgi:hypothetical protein